MVCFFGDVSGDIMASLFVVDEIIALESVHIDEPATRFGLISIVSKALEPRRPFAGSPYMKAYPA